MSSTQHTVIVVPHSRAKVRRWRFSSRQLALTGVITLVVILVSVFSIVSLLGKAVDQHQLNTLAQENQELRQANQEFETSLRDLRTQLSEIEQRTQELAIVAGVDGLDVSQQSGVGGLGIEHRALGLDDELDQIEARLIDRDRWLAATPAISPVRGILTSGYGWRTDPITGKKARHHAIDLSTAPGRPVIATADGIVLKAERSGRLGNTILVSHGFGYTTRYAHLSRFQIETGQRVRRGDVLGFVGNTGRTTGYHLHYEVRVDGNPVDPMGYMLDSGPRGLS